MSRKYDYWYAVVESLFGIFKKERVPWGHYRGRYAAQQVVLQSMTIFYNSQRIYSYLDYKSPNQFEAGMAKLGKAG